MQPNSLYVNDRRDKPFHCSICGDSHEPCFHWDDRQWTTDDDEKINAPVAHKERAFRS
jgi:hypothetical protein